MDGSAASAEVAAARAREIGWVRGTAALLLVGLAAVTLFLGWRSLGWPLIHDAPLMHYVAWRIGEGAVPYRDLFDMNVPGAYLVHLLAMTLIGADDAAWRLFDLAWLGVTGGLVFGYCRGFGIWSAVAAWLLFAAYHLAGGAWRAGQRDFLLCAFLLAGLWGTARAWEAREKLPLLAGGIAFGAAALVKPHALLFLPLLVAAALRSRPCLGGLVLAVTAWASLPLAAGLWLGWAGGLGHFLEIVTRYLPLYSKLERVASLEALSGHSYGSALWSIIGFLVALSLAAAVIHRRFDLRRRLLALGVLYGIIHFIAQGKGWEYHLYPLGLFGLLLATTELDSLVKNGGGLLRALLGGGLGLLTLVLSLKGVEASDAGWIAAKERRVTTVVADLRKRISPGEMVQILDTTEGGIHALWRLRVRQPTRFLYDFHFFHDSEASYIRGLRGELIRELAARPPRLVVLFERGWPRGGYERLRDFPELAEWLEATYAIDRQGDGYRIYARRGDR